LLDFRNNVVYDWKELASHTGSEAVYLNLVNNYYKEGPSTGSEEAGARGVIFTFMSPQPHRVFADGNFVFGSPAGTAGNWSAIRYSRPGKPLKGQPADTQALRAPSPFATPPVTTQSALDAYARVLAGAGATLPSRDAIDLRIVNDIRRGTGAVINYESDIPEPGRWQVYHSLPAPADTDRDGIPDSWEDQFGLDKHDPADAMRDAGRDGYTNLEDYLNNTDPTGGAAPMVFLSAGISRAYRGDGAPGEFLMHRTGSTAAPLSVRYLLGGASRTVTILAGSASAAIPVPPGGEDIVVAAIAPDAAYHIGCPISALVGVENAASPQPVDIARVDPKGGVSDEIRKAGEANMEEHKKVKHPKRKE
jgi:hypothetical protein